MTTRDRIAEREVADFANENRKAPKPKGKRWPRIKRFGNDLLTGFAVGSIIRGVRDILD